MTGWVLIMSLLSTTAFTGSFGPREYSEVRVMLPDRKTCEDSLKQLTVDLTGETFILTARCEELRGA